MIQQTLLRSFDFCVWIANLFYRSKSCFIVDCCGIYIRKISAHIVCVARFWIVIEEVFKKHNLFIKWRKGSFMHQDRIVVCGILFDRFVGIKRRSSLECHSRLRKFSLAHIHLAEEHIRLLPGLVAVVHSDGFCQCLDSK